MPKIHKFYNIFCTIICVLGIIVFLFSYPLKFGKYYGHLNGHISLISPDDWKNHYFYFIGFKAETEPKWRWTEPNNFSYDYIELNIDEKKIATIYFPSLNCMHDDKKDIFSQALLLDLLTENSEYSSKKIQPEQLEGLYNFILSAGNGTLPPPRHHTYFFESPYDASFSHFCLGGGEHVYIAHFGYFILTIGIILLFFGKESEKNVIKKITIFYILGFVNYLFFNIGILLNMFVDTISLGAYLYRTTLFLGALLILASIIYSFKYRYATKYRGWDFSGVFLTVVFYLFMIFEHIFLFG